MAARSSSRRGGQLSMTTPTPPPWLSPKVETRNRSPKTLPVTAVNGSGSTFEPVRHCYLCGKPSPEQDAVPTCPDHGPLWKLVQQGPTSNVLVERDGKVLLAQRGHEPYHGHWCIPGGFVDFGEHPEDAARRELMEEAGVEVTLTGMLGIYVAPYTRPEGTDWIQTTVYLGETEDEPRINDHEMLAVGWFDPDELPEPMVPSHLVRLADWRADRVWRWDGQDGAGSLEPG